MYFGTEPTEPFDICGLVFVAVYLLAQEGEWGRCDNKVNAFVRETLEKFQRIAEVACTKPRGIDRRC
jgi:hypothetical protein